MASITDCINSGNPYFFYLLPWKHVLSHYCFCSLSALPGGRNLISLRQKTYSRARSSGTANSAFSSIGGCTACWQPENGPWPIRTWIIKNMPNWRADFILPGSMQPSGWQLSRLPEQNIFVSLRGITRAFPCFIPVIPIIILWTPLLSDGMYWRNWRMNVISRGFACICIIHI